MEKTAPSTTPIQVLKPQMTSFYMPCPEGSHGEGYYFWKITDDVTGEVVASGSYGGGCENDEPPV